MEDFNLEMGFRQALELYLYLKAREEELSGGAAGLFDELRSYLYERLSIEEMEHPELLLARLGRGR